MLEAPIHNEGVSVINIYILSSKCFLKTEPKKKKKLVQRETDADTPIIRILMFL